MSIERTLSIVKPDAVRRGLTGEVLSRIEGGGLRVIAAKYFRLTKKQAAVFYRDHSCKPFYDELISSMSSGLILVSVLEGDNAIARNREIIGATDPGLAACGTIRGDLALSVGENSVHGSDKVEAAESEIAFFFTGCELVD